MKKVNLPLEIAGPSQYAISPDELQSYFLPILIQQIN